MRFFSVTARIRSAQTPRLARRGGSFRSSVRVRSSVGCARSSSPASEALRRATRARRLRPAVPAGTMFGFLGPERRGQDDGDPDRARAAARRRRLRSRVLGARPLARRRRGARPPRLPAERPAVLRPHARRRSARPSRGARRRPDARCRGRALDAARAVARPISPGRSASTPAACARSSAIVQARPARARAARARRADRGPRPASCRRPSTSSCASAGTAGATVLFSSHVLSEVEALCERVGMIRDGRMITVRVLSEMQASRPQARPYRVRRRRRGRGLRARGRGARRARRPAPPPVATRVIRRRWCVRSRPSGSSTSRSRRRRSRASSSASTARTSRERRSGRMPRARAPADERGHLAADRVGAARPPAADRDVRIRLGPPARDPVRAPQPGRAEPRPAAGADRAPAARHRRARRVGHGRAGAPALPRRLHALPRRRRGARDRRRARGRDARARARAPGLARPLPRSRGSRCSCPGAAAIALAYSLGCIVAWELFQPVGRPPLPGEHARERRLHDAPAGGDRRREPARVVACRASGAGRSPGRPGS